MGHSCLREEKRGRGRKGERKGGEREEGGRREGEGREGEREEGGRREGEGGRERGRKLGIQESRRTINMKVADVKVEDTMWQVITLLKLSKHYHLRLWRSAPLH